MSVHLEGRPRLYIADDDPTMRILLAEASAAAGFDVTEFGDGTDLLRAAEDRLPDCVLLDVNMPVLDGFGACEALRRLSGADLLPIVLVTGDTDTTSINRAFDVGATDFISKPINWSLFAYRLRYIMRNASNSIELRRREQRIHKLAFYDALTGLPNRQRLREMVDDALAGSTDGAMLYLDLDRFKRVNDAFGHSFGDQLLIAVARRLEAGVDDLGPRARRSVLARLGGDEFVCYLTSDSAQDAAVSLAESWIAALGVPVIVEHTELFVTPSIGITLGQAGQSDFETLLMQADTAMYTAKTSGTTHYASFADSMQHDVSERIDLENGLRRAIRRDELTLHYQPKVEAATGRLLGVEALARWHDADRGFVPPGKFVPVAEDSGLIKELDQWVIRRACAQLREWLDVGLNVPVAVNLSADFFGRADIAAKIAEVCIEFGVPPSMVVLEITESTLMTEARSVAMTLRQLKACGFQLAIDDFGTGYSSLSYLRQFALDQLKIDRSFVAEITDDAEAAALCESIIALAKSIHLTVVAEGVETEAQQRWLTEHECDVLQGYLLARPMPADQIYEFATTGKVANTAAAEQGQVTAALRAAN
ncbi:MAG: EAL domain-containing protein [Pseudomonadota bacterium]